MKKIDRIKLKLIEDIKKSNPERCTKSLDQMAKKIIARNKK